MGNGIFDIATKGRVNINPVKVAEFLNSGDGPVLRKMIVVGEAVKVRTIESLKQGFPRDFLGPTIVKRIVTTPKGPTVLVGSEKLTTRPHPIQGNPVLVFDWPKAGGTVFFRSVNHPGSDFSEYLSKKLLEAVAMTRGII